MEGNVIGKAECQRNEAKSQTKSCVLEFKTSSLLWLDTRNVVFWQRDRDLGNILTQFKSGFGNFEERKTSLKKGMFSDTFYLMQFAKTCFNRPDICH